MRGIGTSLAIAPVGAQLAPVSQAAASSVGGLGQIGLLIGGLDDLYVTTTGRDSFLEGTTFESQPPAQSPNVGIVDDAKDILDKTKDTAGAILKLGAFAAIAYLALRK